MKILGYPKWNNSVVPLNFIFMYTRRCVFSCAKNGHDLNFFIFQKQLQLKDQEEEMLARIKCQHTAFHTFGDLTSLCFSPSNVESSYSVFDFITTTLFTIRGESYILKDTVLKTLCCSRKY